MGGVKKGQFIWEQGQGLDWTTEFTELSQIEGMQEEEDTPEAKAQETDQELEKQRQ